MTASITNQERLIKLTKKIQKDLRNSIDTDLPAVDEFQFLLHVLGTVVHITIHSFTAGGQQTEIPIFNIWCDWVRDLIVEYNEAKMKEEQVH